MQQDRLLPKHLGDIPREERSFGQRAADTLTSFVGSWKFIFILLLYIFTWISLNITAYIQQWDPWPFIILNLTLSCLAALHAPVILMSQKRTEERNNKRVEYDYFIDRKSIRMIEDVEADTAYLKKAVARIESKLSKKR